MKRQHLFRILVLSVLTAIGFASCDEEALDQTLLDPTKVGESIVRYSYQDTLIVKKNVAAFVDKTGTFQFKVAAKNGDSLNIKTLKFETGVFPANVNLAEYYFSSLNDIGVSFDFFKPQYNTGWVKINSINKVANVVSGEFEIKIYPPVINPDKIRPFEIKGEFRNLRYERTEKQYVQTKIDGRDFSYDMLSVSRDMMTGERILTTSNTTNEEKLEIRFNRDLEVGAPQDLTQFKATYISASGVAYSTNAELAPSTLTILEQSPNFSKAAFNLKMFNASGSLSLDFADGAFRIVY